jgi:hypothetical protein
VDIVAHSGKIGSERQFRCGVACVAMTHLVVHVAGDTLDDLAAGQVQDLFGQVHTFPLYSPDA